MGARDEAAAQGQRRAMHLIDAEEMEPHAGAGDVDDRVDRAHVVEVHVVDGGAVDARLRLSEPLCVDPYAENRETGAFILIEEATNDTVGAGMVVTATP